MEQAYSLLKRMQTPLTIAIIIHATYTSDMNPNKFNLNLTILAIVGVFVE